MRHLCRAMLALVLLVTPALVAAQTVGGSVQFPAGYAPGVAICIKQTDGTCPPVSSAMPIPSASVPKAATSLPSGGSVVTANAFQSALAASPTRLGCAIQNTSASNLLIYVGAVGNANAAASLVVAPGAIFGCAVGGLILTDQISVTSGTAGSTYVVIAQ